jgi:hypothetical protein
MVSARAALSGIIASEAFDLKPTSRAGAVRIGGAMIEIQTL